MMILLIVFRFSLLLLEYGETYFEDFAVSLYLPEVPEAEAVARLVQVVS